MKKAQEEKEALGKKFNKRRGRNRKMGGGLEGGGVTNSGG
jgi:hypothetical protein